MQTPLIQPVADSLPKTNKPMTTTPVNGNSFNQVLHKEISAKKTEPANNDAKLQSANLPSVARTESSVGDKHNAAPAATNSNSTDGSESGADKQDLTDVNAAIINLMSNVSLLLQPQFITPVTPQNNPGRSPEAATAQTLTIEPASGNVASEKSVQLPTQFSLTSAVEKANELTSSKKLAQTDGIEQPNNGTIPASRDIRDSQPLPVDRAIDAASIGIPAETPLPQNAPAQATGIPMTKREIESTARGVVTSIGSINGATDPAKMLPRSSGAGLQLIAPTAPPPDQPTIQGTMQTPGMDAFVPVGISSTQSANTKPANIQPANIQPANIQPANIQPANIQPVDVQPVDVQPVDVRPADVQPADENPKISTANAPVFAGDSHPTEVPGVTKETQADSVSTASAIAPAVSRAAETPGIPGKPAPTEEPARTIASAPVKADTTPAIPTAQLQALHNVQPAPGVAPEHIPARVGSSSWDHAVGQKVVWMAGNGLQSAELSLNPPDLGPLQVVLNVSNDQASANFFSAQPEVREALESALPKLRQMMNDAGVQLSGFSVNAQTSGQGQAYSGQHPQHTAPTSHSATITNSATQPPNTTRTTATSSLGIVDTFA